MNQEEINLYNYASKQADQLILKEVMPYLLIEIIATITGIIIIGMIIKKHFDKMNNIEKALKDKNNEIVSNKIDNHPNREKALKDNAWF